jgi:hypothetical protein
VVNRLGPRAALAASVILCATGARGASVWLRTSSPGPRSGVPQASFGRAPGESAGTELLSGRVLLRVSNVDEENSAAITAAIEARLASLFAADSWTLAFSPEAPLQIRLTALPGPALSAVSVSAAASAVALNVSGHTPGEIAEEAARDVLAASLETHDPGAPRSVVAGFSRAASLPSSLSAADLEEIREAGASPTNSLDRAESEIFSALWLSEMASQAGPAFLPDAWRAIGEVGDYSLPAAADYFARTTGKSPESAFHRALERAYSSVSVLPDFAALDDADLGGGALDAAAPGPRAWRFFSYTPQRDGGLALAWPADGASGFARIHYQGGLPADLVEFPPGSRKTLPLAGVSRIDWVVVGGPDGAASLPAPAAVSPVTEFPYSGLTAHATANGGDGVSLEWSTAVNQDVSGWAILRQEVDGDGRVTQSPPQWVPAGISAGSGESYVFLDPSAAPGHFYQYDIWAVTDEGALSRSFRVVLRAR